MSDWKRIELYATFIKVTGEVEVIPPERLIDSVNRYGDYMELRNAVTEPLGINNPVLARRDEKSAVAKASVTLALPLQPTVESNKAMWREKVPQTVSIVTQAYSMVCDVHLEPRRTLRDHLDRFRADFLPITNMSALWVGSLSKETYTLQAEFALLNPSAILSFSLREGE